MPSLTLEEAYRSWRNNARKFSLLSILQKCFAALGTINTGSVEGLRHAPWNILLIVKWVCQDPLMISKTPITDQQFYDLRQDLWTLPDRVSVGAAPEQPIFLMFRQLTNPQLGFQKRMARGFVREAAILDAMQSNNAVRTYFTTQSGLEPSEFIDLAYVTFALLEKSRTLTLQHFGPVRDAYGTSKLQRFLEEFSATSDELIVFFRSLPDRRRKVLSEYFEFPTIKRFPFLRENEAFHCWHKAVAHRSLEGYVHSVLSRDSAVFQKFTGAFEGYVIEQARDLPAPFYDDRDLKAWLAPGSSVPDGLVAYSDANIFIESKAGIFDESLMTVGQSSRLRDRTKPLAKAISQGRAAAIGLRSEGRAPESITAQTVDYLLVVTNRELAMGNGLKLFSMYPSGASFAYSDSLTLPLERVYFLSIEDFERLVAAGIQGLHLPDVLSDCVSADACPGTSVFFFEQHLDRLGLPRRPSALVARAEDAALARVSALVRDDP